MSIVAKRGISSLVFCLALFMPLTTTLGAETDAPLADRLRSSDWYTLYQAIKDVGSLPPGSRAGHIPRLIELLNHDDQTFRINAADTLCDMGADARIAIPHIIQNFAQPHGEESLSYVNCVEGMGEIAVPDLIDALDDPAHFVRQHSISALRAIGPPAHAALEPLEALRNSAETRLAADRAIAAITAPPTLEGRFAAADPITRDNAFYEFTRLEPEARVPFVPYLERYLAEKDRTNSFSGIAEALCDTGPLSEDLIPLFMRQHELGEDRHSRLLVGCVAALGVTATPRLIEALEHPKYFVRVNALNTLGRIGPPARSVVPALRSILARPEVLADVSGWNSLPRIETVNLAEFAERALAAIDPEGTSVGSSTQGPGAETDAPLTNRLGSSNWPVLLAAIREVGTLPPEDRLDHSPRLVDALNNDDSTIRIEAATVLCSMGADVAAAIPIIIRRLTQTQGDRHCLASMGNIAVPALIDALADPDPAVRGHAITVLGKTGSDAQAALGPLEALTAEPAHASDAFFAIIAINAPPTLEGRFTADNPITRANAYREVAAMEPAARVAYAPYLERYLAERDDANGFFSVATLLCSTGVMSEDVIPLFIREFQVREDRYFRRYVDCVAGFGAAAVPQLIAALEHPKYFVRVGALETLAQIGPPAHAAAPAVRSILARPVTRADVARRGLEARIETVSLTDFAERALVAIEAD